MQVLTDEGDVKRHTRKLMQGLLLNHHVIPFPTEVFGYILEQNPSSVKPRKNGKTHSPGSDEYEFDDPPLTIACSNPHITAEAVQLILSHSPESVREVLPSNGFLPIHTLSSNGRLNDESSIEILELLIGEYPESAKKQVSPREREDDFSWRHGEDFPIHLACEHKSFDFCKRLLELNPHSVSERVLHFEHATDPPGSKMLPFHLACRHGSLDLVKYLFEKYTQSLFEHTLDDNYNRNEEGGWTTVEENDNNSSLLRKGNFPLHLAVSRENCLATIEIVDFLLKKDPGAVSKVGKWGNLPLHQACSSMYHRSPQLDILGKLFCLHPGAIHTANLFGRFPIHLAIRCSDENNIDDLLFLAKQLPYSLRVMDSRGLSCAHYACTSEGSVEKLEMIVDIFPDAIRSQR